MNDQEKQRAQAREAVADESQMPGAATVLDGLPQTVGDASLGCALKRQARQLPVHRWHPAGNLKKGGKGVLPATESANGLSNARVYIVGVPIFLLVMRIELAA